MALAWKIYFWIIALQIFGVPIGVFLLSSISAIEIINWVFVVAGAIGLYGFVYTKPVFTEHFWRLFLPAFIAWDVVFLGWLLPNQESQVSVDSYELKAIMIFLFVLPQYFGIYRYAFYHSHLWRTGIST